MTPTEYQSALDEMLRLGMDRKASYPGPEKKRRDVLAQTIYAWLHRDWVPSVVSEAANKHCCFCFKHPLDAAPKCSYGLGHEFPGAKPPAPVQPKKIDTNVCLACGLHRRNPVAVINGCVHQYSEPA